MNQLGSKLIAHTCGRSGNTQTQAIANFMGFLGVHHLAIARSMSRFVVRVVTVVETIWI
jgi:hypothetical protein